MSTPSLTGTFIFVSSLVTVLLNFGVIFDCATHTLPTSWEGESPRNNMTPIGIFVEVHFTCQGWPTSFLECWWTWHVSVQIRDWPQNGYNCGHIAYSVIQRCLQDGFKRIWQFQSEADTALSCGHIICQVMLEVIKDQCLLSYRDYMHFRHHPSPINVVCNSNPASWWMGRKAVNLTSCPGLKSIFWTP